MLKKIYLSPIGYIISFIQNILALFHEPFMVYGYYNKVQKKFMKYTRISSNTKIMSKAMLDIEDGVWIGHYSLIDASNGVKIGRCVQTGSHVSIFSHSSHNSIRLLGDSYLSSDERVGYVNAGVSIGDYTFIGTGSVIFPGTTIGKGCLVKAGSILTKTYPDYSIISGNLGKVVGNVMDIDKHYFTEKVVQENYFDKEIMTKYISGEQ